MDRFNALPFAERKALTDPSFAPRQPPKMMLPDVVAPSAPAVREIGAQGRRRHMNEWFEDLSAFLDASTPLWLAPNLSTRQPIEVDEIVLITVAAANMSVGAYRPSFYSDDVAFARLIKEEIGGVLLLLVAACVVEPRGDAFTLMPLGRHAMIDVMRGVGYQFDVIGPVDDASARQLLDILKSVDDDQIDAVWVDWQSGWTGAEKAKALVGVLGDAPSVVDRLHTVQLFDRIGVDAEPSVRTLLHGPCVARIDVVEHPRLCRCHGFADRRCRSADRRAVAGVAAHRRP